MRLENKVCVVTGGARGIGEAIANRFAAEGATLALWDLDGAAATETAARFGGTGHACDVQSRADVERAHAETIAAHGRVDVLVNNAGVALAGPSETFSDADWDASIGVMQTGVFLCLAGRRQRHARAPQRVDRQHLVHQRVGGVPDAARVLRRQGRGRRDDRGPRHRVGRPRRARERRRARRDAHRAGAEGHRRGCHRRRPLHRPDAAAPLRRARRDRPRRALPRQQGGRRVRDGHRLRIDGGWSAQGWIIR